MSQDYDVSQKWDFEAVPIGLDMGTIEITLDKETITDALERVQWKNKAFAGRLRVAPPGMTVGPNGRLIYEKFTNLHAGIWAKSAHEFLKPMKMGSKIFIRGKVADKYVKRDRNYVVYEYEVTDEAGDVLMRSREDIIHFNIEEV